MNVLFIVHPDPNYILDLLLHGFRKIIGPAAVEFPGKDCLYEEVIGFVGMPDEHTIPRWFPANDGQIDRSDIFQKVEKDISNTSSVTSGYFPNSRKSCPNGPPVLLLLMVRIRPSGYRSDLMPSAAAKQTGQITVSPCRWPCLKKFGPNSILRW